MGIGDEIIASGHALRAFEKNTKPVLILDSRLRPRWSGMWEGLSWIVKPDQAPHVDYQTIKNGARCRPYIDYRKGFTRQTGMNYSKWRVRDNPGFIQLMEHEIHFAKGLANFAGRFVVIEPHIEASSNPNKQWGWNKWQSLADLLNRERMCPVQVGPPGTVTLKGVRLLNTPTIRHAAALMKFARWSILPDAGLQHVAGVLGLPATVLWGGANDPVHLGYPDHSHIFYPTACRRWMPCGHCAAIWNLITPEQVWNVTRPRMESRYGEDFRSC